MSTAVPPSTIKISGPLTRGDLLLLLYWFSDTNRVPEVVGIQGLSRLTRLSLILGDELGLRRTIDPFFEYHRTPAGGIASADVWSELLALRAYQVLKPLPSDEPMPPEEIEERRYLLEHHIPAHERSHYPLPTYFERDVLGEAGGPDDPALDRGVQDHVRAEPTPPIGSDRPRAPAPGSPRGPLGRRSPASGAGHDHVPVSDPPPSHDPHVPRPGRSGAVRRWDRGRWFLYPRRPGRRGRRGRTGEAARARAAAHRRPRLGDRRSVHRGTHGVLI